MTFYLLYLSSAKELYSDADLSNILSKSRVNNKLLNITGMLLYHDGNILQVLEGKEETVMNLYYKIKRDQRHINILKMVSGNCEERNFPEWSMGFKVVTDAEWNEYANYFSLGNSEIAPRLNAAEMKVNTLVKSFLNLSLRE